MSPDEDLNPSQNAVLQLLIDLKGEPDNDVADALLYQGVLALQRCGLTPASVKAIMDEPMVLSLQVPS